MVNRSQIIPHLWFDREAKEAAEFYTSVYPNSKISNESVLHDTPSGDAPFITFDLFGSKFMAISAGPYFKFNPSTSFIVKFDPSRMENAEEQIINVWNELSEGGKVLMPLDRYPFSRKYGWIQDQYGLSWQLSLSNPEDEEHSALVPSLMFTGDQFGKAEEAIRYYLSVLNHSREGRMIRYPEGTEADKEGKLMFADFMIGNQWFAAMDSTQNSRFSFNESISFMVYCDTQEEIDYYWHRLSAVPEAEQCGWLKDRFGVSWQIVPSAMDDMMNNGTSEQINRITRAILQMKKIDVEALQSVYRE